MIMDDPTPDAPPSTPGFELSALSAYSIKPGSIEGVSFWPRAAARVIDFLVHFAVSTATGFLFGAMLVIAASGHLSPLVVQKLRQTSVVSFLLALVGSITYHSICEGLHGSTIGKRMLSMAVVQEDGAPCRLSSGIVRSFSYLVDALFFGLVGYLAMQKTLQEQRHGDEWAHTVVCKRSKIVPANLRSDGRFVAVVLGAMAADSALLMVSLLLKLNDM